MSYRHSIHFPPPPPPPPPPRPSSEPPQFAFHPQRAPFAPPPLLQEESSGTTFLADLADVSIPPVRPSILNPQAPYVVKCNCCGADLTGRPRVHCMQCEDYDVCSHCHAFGEIGRGHRKTHTQQTLKPMEYPRIHRRPYISDRAYRCDVCNKDLTTEPRARCVECKSYDLCLDCNLTGETSLKHRASHNINIITSHLDTDNSIVLMGSDYMPTVRLEKLVDSLFDYIDTEFTPRNTSLIEPAKLSAFYSSIGVRLDQNIGRFSNEIISREYSSMGCEYHLVSDNTGEIQARSKPWNIDSLDTTPRSPALTKAGWIRFFVLTAWKDPDLMHFVLSNALSTGKIIHKRKAEPYRLSVPRESFPRRPRPVRRPEPSYR